MRIRGKFVSNFNVNISFVSVWLISALFRKIFYYYTIVIIGCFPYDLHEGFFLGVFQDLIYKSLLKKKSCKLIFKILTYYIYMGVLLLQIIELLPVDGSSINFSQKFMKKFLEIFLDTSAPNNIQFKLQTLKPQSNFRPSNFDLIIIITIIAQSLNSIQFNFSTSWRWLKQRKAYY